MSDSTRRGFLKVAGTGVAVAGAVAVVPSAAHAATRKDPDTLALPDGAEASLVAYVEDVSTGKVALMVEGHEYTVIDHQLVARLAHAMHAAKSV
ncbi:twin-arginine translocation signal domain-containing protein [uncultured Jatrophihabitans sp.]|uniref:twin-arginine translocation signal domain-containing protein n=1 Tax=uncultured Jatrophihabitans sp. TaxID=1610747 RepID=UPI0035CA8B8E